MSSCPGFKPHGVKPMKCRRCFKDYSEHPQTKSQLDLSYSFLLRDRSRRSSREVESETEDRRSSYGGTSDGYGHRDSIDSSYANDSSTSWPRVRRRERGAYTDDEGDLSSSSVSARRRRQHVTFEDEATSSPSYSSIRRRRMRRMANGSDFFSTSLDGGMSTGAESEGDWMSDAPSEAESTDYRRRRLRHTQSEDYSYSYDRDRSPTRYKSSDSESKKKTYWFEEPDEPNEDVNNTTSTSSSKHSLGSQPSKVNHEETKSSSVNSEEKTSSKTLTSRPESPRTEAKSTQKLGSSEKKTTTTSGSSKLESTKSDKSSSKFDESPKVNDKPPIKSILKTDSSKAVEDKPPKSILKTENKPEPAPSRSSILRAELARIEEKLANRASLKAEKAKVAEEKQTKTTGILKTDTSKTEEKPVTARASWLKSSSSKMEEKTQSKSLASTTPEPAKKVEEKPKFGRTESPRSEERPFSPRTSFLKSDTAKTEGSKASEGRNTPTSEASKKDEKPPVKSLFRPESPKVEEKPVSKFSSLRKVEEKPPSPKPPVASRIEERRASLLGRFEQSKSDDKPTPIKTRTESPKLTTKKDEKPVEPSKKIEIIAAKEVESADQDGYSTDVEFVVQVKPKEPSKEKKKFSTTETAEATVALHEKTISDLNSTVTALKKQLESTEEKCGRLEKEKADAVKRKLETEAFDKAALDKANAEVKRLRTMINEMDAKNDELKKENKGLKQEVKKVREEMDGMKPKKNYEKEIGDLQGKLKQSEKTCEELMEQNEEMKKEVKKLEEELEELHDNFREDQASEFRDLKRELEANAKNCRVLQFKLKKAERSCDQLEIEKAELEEKLRNVLETTKIHVDQTKIKELETELKLAKEVSTKMHNEIETQKEIRKTLETEMNNLRQQIMLLQNDPSRGAQNKARPVSPSMPGGGKDYETLARDLYDTLERETDLREQLRFAEEETRNVRKKLTTLEQENEILMLQIRKMASPASKGKDDDEEDLSAEELKLQLDLNEQEMQVLRRKVDELETENENLQKEVRYLQDKVVNQPTNVIQLPEIKPGSSPNVIYEHKIRILENEAKELRKKIVDKDRENETLRTELDVHRRKASRVIVRSRSLDGDIQVDLKRQLQLVEQEAGILRQKVMNLESDNEKLTAENKRLSLRLTRKPPPGPADELQLENLLLQEKVKDLEGKIKAIKEEFEKVASGSVPPTIIQEYKPKKESMTDTENELINSLKKRVKVKEDENSNLQNKLTQCEVENHRLNRELKKLKDTINYKKRPPRAVRETATRGELKEIIKELEDEISEMHITLRGREVMTEGMQEELDNTKRELEAVQNELKMKEESVSAEIEELKNNRDSLKEELEREREKAKSLDQKLKQMAQQKGTDVKLLEQIETLQKEKKKTSKHLEETESKVVQQQKQIQELTEKLDILGPMKDELMQSSKLLEGQKKELEEELEKHKKLLSKAEKQVKQLTEKLDASDKDLVSLKKECNQLRNELEEERGRLRQADDKVSEVSVNWSRERDDLKREINDLRTKNESLEKELEDKIAQWEETEKQIRENMALKREKAVQEVKEEAEAEIQALTDEANTMKAKLNEALEQLERTEEELKDATEKHRSVNNQFRKERDEWQLLQAELEGKLRSELRKRERMERDHEMAIRMKDEDLLSVKDRLVQAERDQRRAQQKMEQVETDLQDKIRQLEKELTKEKQDYEELSTKYEIMEEDFVHTKSLFTSEKEEMQKNYGRLRAEFDETFTELKTLKETFNNKQNSWITERVDLQEKIKEMELQVKRVGAWEQERKQLLSTLEQKEGLIESYKKEERHLKDEREKLRRQIEDLEKKVSELERAEKAYRVSTITAKAEGAKEANDLRIHLDHSDKVHKAEMAAMKAEYEGRIGLMGEEIQNLQKMFNNAIKERDTMRARLEELRVDPDLRFNSKYKDEADDLRAQCHEVRNLLEEALLENRNMKVQHASERSSWQIQMAEMKTKVNQLEEKNLLETSRSTGRNFAKTRLELAWEKERSEQQRLLSETQKFVNELKDKVIQMETLREKERQEARKQLQELKTCMDRDQQETQSVVADLQLGLVDLRDKHVRLRAQYERLRKDRERLLFEREEFRDRLISLQEIQVKIAELTGEVQSVSGVLISDESGGSTSVAKEELRTALEKIQQRAEELRKASIPTKDDERMKRAMSFRRAASSSEVNGQPGVSPSPASSYQRLSHQRMPMGPPGSSTIRAPPRQKGASLNRKCLSLDHTMTAGDLNKIWDSGGELSSANTTPSGSQINLRLGPTHYRGYAFPPGYESDSSFADSLSEFGRNWSRESSVDSTAPTPVKAKKGLKEKLKMLAGKTRSVEDTSGDEFSSPSRAELKEKESSLRSRISKALKKPISRSGSTEKSLAGHEGTTDALQGSMERPLRPVSENSHLPPAGANLVPSKGDKGSKKSLLGRLTMEKVSRSKSTESDSGNSTMRSSKSSLNPSETRV